MYIVFNQARKQIFFNFFSFHFGREREQTKWELMRERERGREREMVGIIHLVMKYTGMSFSEAERKQRKDVTIIIMNSMALSTWLIALHVWLPTELLAKLCQKSSECLDTMILSTASPGKTNIFMTSCTQAVLASEFLVIFCWGSTTLASAAEGIHLPKY